MQDTLRISTDARLQTVEITDRVAECVPADIAGTCHVFSCHTTAGVLVNEDEPRFRDDLERFLADLVPDSGRQHDDLDNNADSHLRAALVGPDATVPVRDGDLALGTWQSLFPVECDGPRGREVVVTVTAGVKPVLGCFRQLISIVLQNPPENLHIHHIVPYSRGGPTERKNLTSLCQECHTIAHRFSYDYESKASFWGWVSNGP